MTPGYAVKVMSSSTYSLPWDDVDSSTGIEAGTQDDIMEDEEDFEPSLFDLESASAFGSITSSVLRHSYENGRRVRFLAAGRATCPD